MSVRERIAQVAHDKWATMSDLLRSIMINERMSDSLKDIWLKTYKILFFGMFYIAFLLKKWAIRSENQPFSEVQFSLLTLCISLEDSLLIH